LGHSKEEDAFAILQTFVDGGGNFIDTADVYGSGISEKTIGRFLKTQKSRSLLRQSWDAGMMDKWLAAELYLRWYAQACGKFS
jgi:hypothetical protein